MRCLRLSVASLLTLLCISLWNVDTCMAKRSAQQARFFADAQRSSNGIVELKSSKEFEEAIASPRDFSLALLLTAVDSAPINCVPCKAFQPNFEGVARGFKKVKASDLHDRHLFAYVEFKNGREIFQKLQLSYAPILLFYPPTTGPHAAPSPEPEQYDFNRLGFEGPDLADEVSKRLGVKVSFDKKINWQLTVTVAIAVSAVATLVMYLAPRLASAGNWTPKAAVGLACKALVLATITVMCAGHMWNGIRNAPYLSADASGKPQYFAPGFQNQYGAETQIVAIIYGILAFSITSLAVLIPTQRDPVKQRAAVYVWSAILLAAFSLLLYVFRLKNPSYPFVSPFLQLLMTS